ncbi:hypothetical protein Cci01nite_58940 [Catellatospora citrea]|uniref:Uncharacterized protein n=1 Tax=Catellatospora citrea TaxID=53366 RepID=A0A8J3KPH2_9ACTN|nr:hypothetical protein C8E86_7232 [Catellatospora citrea]GIG00801.1 hypothetical protein Cci01nite_58940 [Catellatospora citrea]
MEELAAVGMTRDEGYPGYWFTAGGLAYEYWLQAPDCEIEPAELQLIAKIAGAAMRCDVVLHTLVSDPTDGPALARIAQRVAGRTDGWVFIEFRVPPSALLLRHLSSVGRCIEVGNAAYLDAAAMEAWLAHPDYHFVK